VTALRETSIVYAPAMGVPLLEEGPDPAELASTKLAAGRTAPLPPAED
jgi:hypothetical protein